MHFCGTPSESSLPGICGNGMFWAMRKNEVPGSFEKKECFKACGKKKSRDVPRFVGCEMLSLKGRFDEAEIAAKFGL